MNLTQRSFAEGEDSTTKGGLAANGEGVSQEKATVDR